MLIPSQKFKSFKHSGDAGDCIYGMAAIHALNIKSHLYLNINPPFRNTLEDGSISLFTKEKTERLIDLLASQPYISKVKIWEGEPIDIDLDLFRKFIIGYPAVNICESHLRLLNLPLHHKDKKWLSVEPKPVAEIVIARSGRYRNNSVWNFDLQKFVYSHNSIFVGHKREFEDFQRFMPNIPHYETKNLLEVAQIIAGSRIFIGNQSSPFSIAEGLKHNSILEVANYVPNCVFQRNNSLNLYEGVSYDRLNEFEGLLKTEIPY